MSLEQAAHAVFISHAHLDQAVAREICATLEARGIRCWIAPRDSTPGEDNSACIVRAIRECPIFVLVYSEHTNDSTFVARELEHAVSNRARILPFKITDHPPAERIALLLGTSPWLEATVPPLMTHLRTLADTAEAILAETSPRGGPLPPARAPTAALEGSGNAPEDPGIEAFIADVDSLRPGVDKALLRRACLFSARAHEGQFRMSGDSYITHCVAVARILAGLRLDSITIACGLLHDIVEDSPVQSSEVEERFGKEIAGIIDGVSHISAVRFQSHEQAQRMLLSMVKDVRVVLIKLADRLHNMRTLRHLPASHQRDIARETREVFAPLADRLGISMIKRELEDLSLQHLEPETYGLIADQLARAREDQETYVKELTTPLLARLESGGIAAVATGRPKHIYSVYLRMKSRGGSVKDMKDMCDLSTVQITVDRVSDCYRALGVVHDNYTPIPDRFQDFIACPKRNLYRSLHTTVIGPRGDMAELRIGTRDTCKTAEEGIAAHWWHTDGDQDDATKEERILWLERALEWLQDSTDPQDFIHFLETGCYPDEVFVFTPTGVRTILPQGSTPIDFAYARETRLGNQCVAAKVNGRTVALDHELKNSDIVEIITEEGAQPRRDWLKFVKTTEARSEIRRWLKARGYGPSVNLGLEMIQREFRGAGRAVPSDKDLEGLAAALGSDGREDLLAAVGFGEIACEQLLSKLYPAEPKPKALDGGGGSATVFLSAKSDDREYAYPIYEFLAKRGVSTFFSMESLPELGNADYRKVIDRALAQARHMVLVTSSKENVNAPWVEAEWGVFINEKRCGRKAGNIITVLAGDMRLEDLPLSLRYYQVIPFDPKSLERIIPYLR